MFDVVRVQPAALIIWHGTQQRPCNSSASRRFVPENMRFRPEDDLIAAVAPAQHGKQVAHCAAGDVDGGLLAHSLGSHGLKALHGGVVSQDVVAHFRLEHGLPHLGCRVGHRVAAQVNCPHASLRIVVGVSLGKPRVCCTL